ncbi:MAG: hypothetical protein HUU37_00565 [Bdellovibrionales bacterium]|nr:hypothetical protein [Bdellovibrionales bacterium]
MAESAPPPSGQLDCSSTGTTPAASQIIPVEDGQGAGSLQDDLARRFDVGYSPNTLLVTVQDSARLVRGAFQGHAVGANSNSFRLSLNDSQIRCRSNLPVRAWAYPAKRSPHPIRCFVDVLTFRDGAVAEEKREISRHRRPILGTVTRLAGENEGYSFEMSHDNFNPATGLRLSLTSKKSGAHVSVEGPATLLLAANLLMLTEGDRSKEAVGARLACGFLEENAGR